MLQLKRCNRLKGKRNAVRGEANRKKSTGKNKNSTNSREVEMKKIRAAPHCAVLRRAKLPRRSATATEAELGSATAK